MPLLIGAIIGGIIQVLGTLVGKILVSLGIGYAVYSGVDTSIVYAKTFLLSRVSSASANTVAVASAIQLGTVVSILTSALTTRLTIQGMTSGTMRRMVQK